jgi:predicted peptidase
MKTKYLIARNWLLLFSLCLAACGPGSTPAPTQTLRPTATATPTNTTQPTDTASPTATAAPTRAPTPAITRTPKPTVTPIPLTDAGEQKGVFMKKTFVSNNGGSIPYQFLIPENSSADQQYPLVVFLHGGGELGSDNFSQLTNFPRSLISGQNKLDYPTFVIAPQCPTTDSWSSFPDYPNSRSSENPTKASQLVIELVESLLTEYNIDASRIYITGMSLGGEGTFDIVSRRPDLFAAAVPICGIADVERASSVKDVPFWIFHGAKDDINLVTYSQAMVEALLAVGASPKYTEYANAGHSVWSQAYGEPELFPWLFSQKKK